MSNAGLRCFQTDPHHCLTEQVAVFCHIDGVGLGADQFYVEFFQSAVFVQRHGCIQRGLAAHGRQNGVWSLPSDNLTHDFRRDWLHISRVGEIWICHDCSGIGIHQNYSIALIPKRFASLRPGIVEFASLANYNWPGADDHDSVDICAFRHWVASLPDTFSPIPARRVGAI